MIPKSADFSDWIMRQNKDLGQDECLILLEGSGDTQPVRRGTLMTFMNSASIASEMPSDGLTSKK
jgi:hypothetical protein